MNQQYSPFQTMSKGRQQTLQSKSIDKTKKFDFTKDPRPEKPLINRSLNDLNAPAPPPISAIVIPQFRPKLSPSTMQNQPKNQYQTRESLKHNLREPTKETMEMHHAGYLQAHPAGYAGYSQSLQTGHAGYSQAPPARRPDIIDQKYQYGRSKNIPETKYIQGGQDVLRQPNTEIHPSISQNIYKDDVEEKISYGINRDLPPSSLGNIETEHPRSQRIQERIDNIRSKIGYGISKDMPSSSLGNIESKHPHSQRFQKHIDDLDSKIGYGINKDLPPSSLGNIESKHPHSRILQNRLDDLDSKIGYGINKDLPPSSMGNIESRHPHSQIQQNRIDGLEAKKGYGINKDLPPSSLGNVESKHPHSHGTLHHEYNPLDDKMGFGIDVDHVPSTVGNMESKHYYRQPAQISSQHPEFHPKSHLDLHYHHDLKHNLPNNNLFDNNLKRGSKQTATFGPLKSSANHLSEKRSPLSNLSYTRPITNFIDHSQHQKMPYNVQSQNVNSLLTSPQNQWALRRQEDLLLTPQKQISSRSSKSQRSAYRRSIDELGEAERNPYETIYSIDFSPDKFKRVKEVNPNFTDWSYHKKKPALLNEMIASKNYRDIFGV